MDDIGRVQAWFRDAELVHPLGQASTVHLARAVSSIAGTKGVIDEHSRGIAARIGETQHLLLVLADGLGMNLMGALPEGSPLRRHCVAQISAVFPSSTAPALTSLATGLWPAQHGLLFWWQYLEESDVSVVTLPFIERFSGRSLTEFGVTSEQLFSKQPQVSNYSRDVLSLQPMHSSESVYTGYYSAGTHVHGYESLDEAADVISKRIIEARKPTYTYLYFSGIDRQEHDYGPDTQEALAELKNFDLEMTRLAETVSGRARIVISADHGQFRVRDEAVLDIEPDDPLLECLLCPPTGEGPAPAFHVRPGRSSEFESLFRERFGAHFALLTKSDVESLGLLGPEPLSRVASSRLGDFIAVTRDPVVLRYGHMPETTAMPGEHGGLSREEMEVPLIVI